MSVHSEQVVLTVQESKRLIAKGLMMWQPFRLARENGTIAVAKGTTNAYVIEEMLGEPIDKTRNVTGHVAPKSSPRPRVSADMPDVVLRDGVPAEGLTAVAAAAEMRHGDIFLKGANAINYNLRQAAALIAHPAGGTLGAALGPLIARRVRVVAPVGLEKDVPIDLTEAAEAIRASGTAPALWVFGCELFTEVEALEAIAAVKAMPVAAGGIGGAEGSVRLLITAEEAELAKAMQVIEAIQGEPLFVANDGRA